MPNMKKKLKQFTELAWDDLEEWAGSRIAARGRRYQQQGSVSDLSLKGDGSLIAWVDGSKRYATQVNMDDGGLPHSVCSCPYGIDCKHGVAVVLEYLARVEENRRIPRASKDDARLPLFGDEDRDDEAEKAGNPLRADATKEIDTFLKGKTKTQLIELIFELAGQYPEISQALADRKQLTSGNTKSLVTRLHREIWEISRDPGWQDYWRGEGYTPDYSGFRGKLETLLKGGHADEVLALGEELIAVGTRQVEESHDEGETEVEVSGCIPVIVKALERSSLPPAEKLAWAVDAVLKDPFEICEPMAEYLDRKHPLAAWDTLADRLLTQLNAMKRPKGADNFGRRYERDRLSNWAIHALERAGRASEIIPLCEAEAQETDSYDRLVDQLIAERRYEKAELWIQKGIRTTLVKWPGIAASLRDKLREVRTRQKRWPVVATIQAEEFIRHPSRETFTECRKAADKVKTWPTVRASLLAYLESGMLPWRQKGWPLPESGLDAPEGDRHARFPMISNLIDLAILEKKPDQVLHWYDQLSQKRFGWHGVDEDEIATAVKTHAPDRAIVLWKNKAERAIAQVKPSAYQEAAKYLRKAESVMAAEKKQEAWERYLQALKEKHARKRRLMEILDGLTGKPILKKRR